MNENKARETCTTCYGKGEVVTELGPVACPDCFGEPEEPRGAGRLEWRLRDIEANHANTAHGCEADVRWLAFQVRRNREALLAILTRCQDEGEGSSLASEIAHVAIESLELYSTES